MNIEKLANIYHPSNNTLLAYYIVRYTQLHLPTDITCSIGQTARAVKSQIVSPRTKMIYTPSNQKFPALLEW